MSTRTITITVLINQYGQKTLFTLSEGGKVVDTETSEQGAANSLRNILDSPGSPVPEPTTATAEVHAAEPAPPAEEPTPVERKHTTHGKESHAGRHSR